MFVTLVSLVLAAAPSGKISIITDGRFHGAEVKPPGTGWYTESGLKLVPVTLKVTKVRDELADDGKPESVKTGAEIESSVKGAFYVKGLAPGPVTVTPLEGQRSLGDGTLVKAGDATLQAITEGEVQKLVLTQGAKTQVLYQQTAGDLDGWALHWAGDLDGDGLQDLLVYADEHYNVQTLRLFLSSRAKKGELLRQVAQFRTTGC